MPRTTASPWLPTPDYEDGERVRVLWAEDVQYLQWNDENGKRVRTDRKTAEQIRAKAETAAKPRTLTNRGTSSAQGGNYEHENASTSTTQRHTTAPISSSTGNTGHRAVAATSSSTTHRSADAASGGVPSDQHRSLSRHRHTDSGYGAIDVRNRPSEQGGRTSSQSLEQQPTEGTPKSFLTTRLLLRFVDIRPNDFEECKSYIAQYPQVLDENTRPLIQEAIQAYQRKNTRYAQNCIRKSIILRDCSVVSTNQAIKYLDDLIDGHHDAVKDFLDECDRVEKKLKSHPATPAAGSVAAGTTSSSGPSRHLERGTSHSSATTSAARPRETDIDTFKKLAGLHIDDDEAQQLPYPSSRGVESSSISRHPPTTGQSTSHSTVAPPGVGTVPRAATLSQDTGASLADPSLSDIRETPGDFEPLDKRYTKRRDAKDFFAVGRVFAILWHENVGEGSSRSSNPAYISKGPYGERIFSHIRRMAVVRERKGYCWCIPINSYGGRGIGGKKMGQDEIEAHTIVYPSTQTVPAPLPTEKGMVKDPIAVRMAPSQTLDDTSRLNFGRVYTVNWNVKVMNVGKVHPDHRAKFEAYWNQER